MKTAARKIIDVFTNRAAYDRFFKSLRYALYVIVHPFDGFWDLTHEKRGSLAAANFILILSLLTSVFRLEFTTFQFIKVNLERANFLIEMLGILLPFIIFVVTNWALTTLFDGKGTLKDVWIASAYAMTPYPLIVIPNTIFSNFLAEEEDTFNYFFHDFSIVWSALLFISAVMMVHAYSIGKTMLCILFTILGMAVVIFLLLLFFSLISDAGAFFYSLYKEVIFRLY